MKQWGNQAPFQGGINSTGFGCVFAVAVRSEDIGTTPGWNNVYIFYSLKKDVEERDSWLVRQLAAVCAGWLRMGGVRGWHSSTTPRAKHHN
jgi:hypothetical protein